MSWRHFLAARPCCHESAQGPVRGTQCVVSMAESSVTVAELSSRSHGPWGLRYAPCSVTQELDEIAGDWAF